LDLGRADAVRDLLDGVDPAELDPADAAWACELAGRAELALGNPRRALQRFDAGDAAQPTGSRRFALAQARGQALSRLGRFAEAAERLADALPDAPDEELAYALHERAIALLEGDALDEAERELEELLLDPDYPHRAEATADLAEVQLRRGDLPGARDTAARALEAGAVGPACLTLGTVAFEYFDLDEATVWLERAVSATQSGDPTWLAAHQLLADVHAQRGPAAAEQVLLHARQALAYAEPGSDWTGPLELHVARARSWLGGAERWLN
jgi:tetratricopeptide (TPR) repeat protein